MTEHSPSRPDFPGESGSTEAPGADVLLREYWRRLVQHRWVVVGCTAFVVVVSMIATFLATPRYTASRPAARSPIGMRVSGRPDRASYTSMMSDEPRIRPLPL